PESGEKVKLPVTVRWRAKDFDLANGNHFGVFEDKLVPKPKRVVRMRICTAGDHVAGVRQCHDDRKQVFYTTETSYTFKCFEPRLLAEGASVVAADINEERLKALAAAFGERLVTMRADVTKETDTQAMVAACVDAFGALDAGFNVAGAAQGGPLEDMTEEA